jgi:Fe(3+) dicitrate transport protein
MVRSALTMLRRHLVLACYVAFAALPCAAQSFAISGEVTDDSGSPVNGATILVTTSPLDTSGAPVQMISAHDARSAVTELDGAYRIDGLSPGRYFVTAYMVGRRLATRAVTIANKSLVADLELSMLESELGEITVRNSRMETFGMTRLQPVDVDGVAIYDARKTEVVVLDDVTANLATNNSRQVYGRVAGLNIWESDGAGLRLGLGGRGLSPNRNANFNTRQNGYDIAADALGYPESYYTPPTRAIERIEIVRGAASLQYGTQFGGLVNFVFKEGPAVPFELASMQTTGSFGLLNSFNSVGGTTGLVGYYAFYQYKRAEGWRPNSGLSQHTAYASLDVHATPQISIRPELTYMRYLAQQPGGLTDAQFGNDPRQSNRARNWFRVHWTLLALRADYRISSLTGIDTRFFGLVAGRDALGNLGRIDRLDFGGPRDLLKDDFRNWGNESRLIHRYPFLDGFSVFLVGTRFYDGFTNRRQGLGPDGSHPDFDYLHPGNLEGSDFDLPSRNVSLFAENMINITPRLSVTPGARFEYIRTQADGYYRHTVEDLAGNVLTDERIDEARDRARSFVFFGLGVSYTASDAVEIYANVSQNYRAITFNDLRVNVGSPEVDPRRFRRARLQRRSGRAGQPRSPAHLRPERLPTLLSEPHRHRPPNRAQSQFQ